MDKKEAWEIVKQVYLNELNRIGIRNYIGIELNPDYLDLIKNRVNETIRPLESFIKAKEGD
jgi:DNA modification methylase